MSVYKRPGRDTYEYDFWHRNHRFCGDTREASKRAALAFENAKKEEAKIAVAAEEAAKAAIETPRTWEAAATRYWLERVADYRYTPARPRSASRTPPNIQARV